MSENKANTDATTPADLIDSEQNFLHDISTPLMVVQGMVESFSLGPLDEIQTKSVESANRNIAKIVDLVKERRKYLAKTIEEVKPS